MPKWILQKTSGDQQGVRKPSLTKKQSPDYFQVLTLNFENIYQNRKCLTDFIKNLQGGFSSGYPDQILNELNILDSYPAENRYSKKF